VPTLSHLAFPLTFTLSLLAAAAAHAEVQLLQPWSTTSGTLAPPWHLAGLPNQKKPFTRFSLVELDGKRAMRIETDDSYGNLVHPLRIDGTALMLSWQWRVDQFVAESDLKTKNGDDSAVKVCVFFDLPLEQIAFVERQVMRIARAASHEPLPAATICYVWDRLLPAGTALDNAYTHRVRYLVLQGGALEPRRWVAERRDVGADFLRLFGRESTQVPPIVGIAIGADADNTHGRSVAHVAELVLAP